MPQRNSILNLPGFTIQKITGVNPVVMQVRYRRKARCIHCNHKKLRKKARFMRQIRHESVGHRPVWLQLKAHKFQCYSYGRYFNQRFPGIEKYQRATRTLHRQIFYQHTQGISQCDLSRNFKLGKATVERWYHRRYQLENQKILNRPYPQVLGIDEHSFSKKTRLCHHFL